MFPTQTDARFYMSRHRPSWMDRIKGNEKPFTVEIDSVIESHAGTRHTDGEMASSNLLFILRLMRRRGKNLHLELEKISKNPECLISPKKRAAFAKKWARRLGAAK